MDRTTLDPELNYCPRCRDEYRAEIARCAACSETLLSGAELLAAREAESADSPAAQGGKVIADGDTLIALQGGSLLDMKRLKGLLAAETVPAVLAKEESCASGGCGGPRIILHIREQDLQRATAVLRRDYAQTTVIGDYEEVSAAAVYNREAAMVSCPACGHQFAPEGSDCPECGLCFL